MSTPGKRVRGAVYVHASAVPQLPPEGRSKLERALAVAKDAPWNVVRLEADAVGLLLYQDFEHDPFPALLASARIALPSLAIQRRDFSGAANPLILHRKELLVAADHPQAQAWAALTADLQARGLFREPHLIGRRRAWQERLAKAGVRVEGHVLCPI